MIFASCIRSFNVRPVYRTPAYNTLHAVLITATLAGCQVVETAYVKDTIARPQYLEQVNSLMSKVNVVLKALETKGEDVNKFLDEYR